MPARFFEHNVRAALKGKRKLSAYLDTLVDSYIEDKGKVALTYIFCSDEYLLDINKQFLNHDTYTDIITFDMTDEGEKLTGEIYISTERIRENAKQFNTSYEDELHRVIFHGALHLCGFKDKTEKDKKQMRQMEDQCLKAYF